MRSYEAARSVFTLLELLAWGLMIFGAIVGLLGGFGATAMSRWGGLPPGLAFLMGVIPGVALALGGFLSLALAQIGRAGVDTAEYSQQMLQLSRDQLEVSRQSLRQGEEVKNSFAALRTPSEAPVRSASFASLGAEPTEKIPSSDQAAAVSSEPKALDYKDIEIQSLERGYRFKGIHFDSLESARAYVDQYLKSANANLKLPT